MEVQLSVVVIQCSDPNKVTHTLCVHIIHMNVISMNIYEVDIQKKFPEELKAIL